MLSAETAVRSKTWLMWLALALGAGCSSDPTSAAGPSGTGGAAGSGGTQADAAVPDASGDAAGDATVDAEPDTGTDATADAVAPVGVATLHLSPGWQIFPGGGYRYGPSMLWDSAGTLHLWSCSPGANGAWDYVRYRSSTDQGKTWSSDVVAVQPTPGSRDALSACDPGAISIGGTFYVGYTSTENTEGKANNLFVARSKSPAGPFEKWNGSGWGGDPQPIVEYTGDPQFYGIGEPSLVVAQGKLFVYYSNIDGAVGHTDVATVDEPIPDDWPAHLKKQGVSVPYLHPAEDSKDVKFVDALGRFVAVSTQDRFSINASLAIYESSDGLKFSPAYALGTRVERGAHNAGISGNLSNHIDGALPVLVGYAYQPANKGWGDWPTFLQPAKIDTLTLGAAACGGSVSSVVGDDWAWSAPRAWDGDDSSVWSSAMHAGAAATESITLDLGVALSVAGIEVVPRAKGYGFPSDFSVLTSADGASFAPAPGASYSSYANPGSSSVTLTFTKPVSARFVRLEATALGVDDFGNHYLQLAEIRPIVE